MIEIGALWRAVANSMTEDEKSAMKAADLDGHPYAALGKSLAVIGTALASGPDRHTTMVHTSEIASWPATTSDNSELDRTAHFRAAAELDGNPYPPANAGIASGPVRALLRILGDMPRPDEDPYERCREIAAAALGYQEPDPMQLVGRTVDATPTYYDIGLDERRPVTQEIVDSMESAIGRLAQERNDARWKHAAEIEAKDAEISLLRQALAAKDARIGELKSVIACAPVAFEDPDAKPAPVPGFLTAIRRGNKAVVGMVTGRGDMPESEP